MDEKLLKYYDALNDVDDKITKYYEHINELWENVIIEYKNNDYGILLDQHNAKTNFISLMSDYPTMKILIETRQRLLYIISKLSHESA